MFLLLLPLHSLVLRGHEQILWTKIVNGIVSFIQKVGTCIINKAMFPRTKFLLALNIWQRILSKVCAFIQGKDFVK